MRIVAGEWRGRTLVSPPGVGTRPTADRVRQALFDMLMHAEWGGRSLIEGAVVLDVFAGTGALGLEALSRGAASACFIEQDAAALKALRANVAACGAMDRARVLALDALRVSPAVWETVEGVAQRAAWSASRSPVTTPEEPRSRRPLSRATGAASLAFFDPPYGADLVPRALARLSEAGWIASRALIVAETGRDDAWAPEHPVLAERQYGAARIQIFRIP